MSKYIFEGETIKINERDYGRMMQLYPNLDLGAELEQLDFELRDTKKWWGQVQAKLNYRNKVNGKSRPNHQDNIRGQAIRAIENLDNGNGAAGSGTVCTDGDIVPGEVKRLRDI